MSIHVYKISIPVTRRSIGDCQLGSSPGFSSSFLCAFPRKTLSDQERCASFCKVARCYSGVTALACTKFPIKSKDTQFNHIKFLLYNNMRLITCQSKPPGKWIGQNKRCFLYNHLPPCRFFDRFCCNIGLREWMGRLQHPSQSCLENEHFPLRKYPTKKCVLVPRPSIRYSSG